MVAASNSARIVPRLWNGYFTVVSALILALTLVGFSDNLLTDVGQPSNSDPKFVVHGLFCLAWVVLFFVQAALVRANNHRLHRKLGIAGMLLAVGVALSTIYVFVTIWKGWDAMGFTAKANRILLPSFAVLVLMAWINRKRADWHKRLIYVATIFMLEPVLSRAYDPLVISWMEPLFPEFTKSLGGLDFYLHIIAIKDGFFLSLFVYDWTSVRRIHPVTLAGFVWFHAIWAIVSLV